MDALLAPFAPPAHEGELRLRIADGLGQRELPIFADLREQLVPRLARRLRRHGHPVSGLDLPTDARPFPGARFAWEVETDAGARLRIRCELRPRALWPSRVGSVRYAVVVEPAAG